MLIDLLCTSNYVSYNVKIAEILGLHTAIYLAEITNINCKAINKSKLNDDSSMTIDREYLKKRTTLDEKEQKEIEKNLLDLGILNLVSGNYVKLNIQALTSILMTNDEKLVEEIKVNTKKKKRNKDECILDNLKNNLVSITNDELRCAYEGWIESVYAKQGWLSAANVKAAIIEVDKFSQRNLDKALEILRIASVNGYRDIQWAISYYYKNRQNTFTISKSNPIIDRDSIKLSEEVF